jgi:hypothetical protein
MSRNASGALIALAVFVLAGPAIGSIAFGIMVTVTTRFIEPDIGLFYLVASILFLPLAYVTGGLHAAFVGAVTAVAIWRSGRAPLWLSLAAAALAGAQFVLRAHEEWTVSVILFSVHLVAALGCWLILRWMPGWAKG